MEEPATQAGRGTSTGLAHAPHKPVASRSRVGRAVKRARERSAVHGYRTAAAAIGRISPRISMSVGKALFVGSYFAWPRRRRIILHNASHVLNLPASDYQVRHLARRIYASYGQFVIELMRMPKLPVDEPLRLMRTGGERGEDSFYRMWSGLRTAGRGMIVVSGHIGSIELLAGYFALRGEPVYGLADDSEYPELFEEINAQRKRWGIEIIAWRNLRRVFAALRQPGLLGLPVDWGYRADDVPVQLFGQWTTLPVGPAMLAAKTGAVILPVVNRRDSFGTYHARHYDLIEVRDSSPASLQRATQQIADALEDMIATAPDQWFSFKPMWPQTSEEKEALARRAAQMLAEA
jgi:lauroyl/myristoyl acyltransferase